MGVGGGVVKRAMSKTQPESSPHFFWPQDILACDADGCSLQSSFPKTATLRRRDGQSEKDEALLLKNKSIMIANNF